MNSADELQLSVNGQKARRKQYAWNDEDEVSTGSALTLTVATSLTLGVAYLAQLF